MRFFVTIKVHSKKDSLASKIIDNIQCGLYEFGGKFPSEQKISEQFNISRTITRRALLDLIEMKILSREVGYGAFINPKALQTIEARKSNAILQVSFILPPTQIENPIIQSIFNTFLACMDERINVKVDFFNYSWPENIKELKADIAIIVGNEYNNDTLNRIRHKVKELILVNYNNPEFNFIVPDNYAGGRLMAEHFISSGHRKIGCLYSLLKEEHSEFNDRYKGACSVFKENGLSLILSSQTFQNVYNQNELYLNLFNSLLHSCPDMTGLLCLKDQTALTLYNLFHAKGIKIPDDMSLIGFDDQLYSRRVEPALTTIKYPTEAIGIKLGEAIESIVQHGSFSIHEEIVPVLLKRQSVKPF